MHFRGFSPIILQRLLMNPFGHFRAVAALQAMAIIPALISSPLLQADENTAQRVAAEEAMRRSNDYYIATFPLGTAVWNRSAYHAGNFRAWETLGVQDYHNHAVIWATTNSWLVGPDAADADSEACGQTYIDLYKINPQPVRIASIQSRIDSLVADPTSVDDWSWIDAFFMAAPTFAKLGALESDPAYFVQLENMYLHMKNTRELFSPTNGLWYRDATAKARAGANTPEFWGRGNGWVIAACARVLEELPAGDPRRPEFAGMLQTMAAALRPLQGTDGFWRSNLQFPNHFSNPETSCTAFFTYAIAYGINEGLLDPPTYTPVVMNAWNGLTTIALHPNGRLGYVQAIGKTPGSADYNAQQDYGYGAFLLAGSEILRLLGGPPPIFADAGPDRTVMDTNEDFTEAVTLDAGRSSIRSGGISHYSWWLGSTHLGDGPQLTLEFSQGSHAVTLHAETTGGETLNNAMTLTVISPRILVTAIDSDANVPENTLDGSLGTRWSQFGTDQWIRYELPSVTVLDHVDIAFYQGNQRRSSFDLQTSTDGTNWNTVFSGQSNFSLELQTFSFPPQPTKFVRYLGHGNSSNLWNSLTEVSIPVTFSTPDPAADADGNGLPAAWEIHHFGAQGQDPAADPNGDGVTLEEDFILGGDPMAQNPNLLQIDRNEAGQPRLTLDARAAFGPGYTGKTRKFRILTSTTLDGGDWQVLPGYEAIPGDNLPRSIAPPDGGARRFYKAASWLE